MIKSFEKFLEAANTAFLHYYPMCSPNDKNTIDLINDLKFKDIIFSEPTKENIEYLNKLLSPRNKNNRNLFLKLYHGTSPEYNILDTGLLKTSFKRKHSYQSADGFVYLSIFPTMAKSFGNMAYGILNAVVYEILVPVNLILPDNDQLNNQRIAGKNINDSIGESILYGHGLRVKGNIPPYWIRKFNI